MIFVNLPVKDLETTVGFFGKLGFTTNPAFSDDKTACLVISDTIFAMLMTEPRFKDFTKKDIVDASKATEVILALNATVDGQTTAHYVTELLAHLPVRVTKLAHGVPVGGELDYLDEGTLSAAIRQRTAF